MSSDLFIGNVNDRNVLELSITLFSENDFIAALVSAFSKFYGSRIV